MRKITIIEVENSFLTLFTPAVVAAGTYILFNVIAWPVLILDRLLGEELSESMFAIVSPLLSIGGLILTIIVLAFVFIPRLKVRYVDYKVWKNYSSFLITGFLICIGIVAIKLLFIIFDLLDWETSSAPPYSTDWSIPIAAFLIMTYHILISSIFDNIMHRRTVIPLLEDRGISPLLAIILASFGSASMNIPPVLLASQITPYHVSLLLLPIITGIVSGICYVLTRNILFPIILTSAIELFFWSPEFLYFLIPIFCIMIVLAGCMYWILVLRKKEEIPQQLTKRSAPLMNRGIIGFFIIIIGLLVIQTLIASIIRIITHFPNDIILYGILVTIFYFLLFLFPFLLSVSTEYASD